MKDQLHISRHSENAAHHAAAKDKAKGPLDAAACCAVVESPEAEIRHMLEVAHANGFRSITAAITFARMARPALMQAEAVLNRNKDIADAALDTVHPAIKAERLALRAVQAVLQHNDPGVASAPQDSAS